MNKLMLERFTPSDQIRFPPFRRTGSAISRSVSGFKARSNSVLDFASNKSSKPAGKTELPQQILRLIFIMKFCGVDFSVPIERDTVINYKKRVAVMESL
jgi:hypothetical protein